jgi:hypothetical protein
MNKFSAIILSLGIILGLAVFGYQLGNALVTFKTWDRSVVVKGLSEQTFPADSVIWPIQFTEASNDLSSLYTTIEKNTDKIQLFLTEAGINPDEITIATPQITDKLAQQYGGNDGAKYRYTAIQTVTVYSNEVDKVRQTMGQTSALVADGIVMIEQQYNAQIEYVFNRLNEVKPAMIEEATLNAREVAEKFAKDSNSQLGKIKRANQGQFSIRDRDRQHPHIKLVRVVSTIEYTLVD